MFHSVTLLSQAPLARGSCALPSVLLACDFVVWLSVKLSGEDYTINYIPSYILFTHLFIETLGTHQIHTFAGIIGGVNTGTPGSCVFPSYVPPHRAKHYCNAWSYHKIDCEIKKNSSCYTK